MKAKRSFGRSVFSANYYVRQNVPPVKWITARRVIEGYAKGIILYIYQRRRRSWKRNHTKEKQLATISISVLIVELNSLLRFAIAIFATESSCCQFTSISLANCRNATKSLSSYWFRLGSYYWFYPNCLTNLVSVCQTSYNPRELDHI